jgi:hypothetical protein
LALASIAFTPGLANAAVFTSASVALTDPRPSATSGYNVTVSSVTSTNIKCVKLVWSTSSTGEVEPTAWDGTAGTVTGGSSSLVNNATWSLARSDGSGATAGADNVWQYTDATGVTPSTLTNATFVTAGITNGSSNAVGYYLKINTFSNVGCTGPVDNGTVQFIYTTASTLSLTVDNSLSFTVNGVASGPGCAGGSATQASSATTIPFGTVTTGTYGLVCQDLTAATNATNGYTIYIRDNGSPTNALSQTISDVSPGTNNDPEPFSANTVEAYGYTTNDVTLSGSAGTGAGQNNRFNASANWAANTTTNSEVAYEAAGVSSTTYRVGHQVAIAATTDPGTYTSTVIYTCTPIY